MITSEADLENGHLSNNLRPQRVFTPSHHRTKIRPIDRVGVVSNSPLYDEINTTISDNERFAISLVELREELETIRRMSGPTSTLAALGGEVSDTRRRRGHAHASLLSPKILLGLKR
jgi:hypothetical protein